MQYAEGHRRTLVEEGVGCVVCRPQFHSRHIHDPSHPPRGVGLDDDIAEVLGGSEASLGLDIELIGAHPRGLRRLAYGSGGDLHIVRPQGRDNVVPGQTVGRRAVGVDPDSHGEIPRRAGADIPHAIDAQDLVLDVQANIVGDILLIARPVGRVHVNGQEEVWRRLAHHDPGRLDLGGEQGRRVLDPIFHQHLIDIWIGAQGKGAGDLKLTVSGGLGRHVEHLLDPVYRLLDRVGDRVGDGLGRGAGIGGGDGHGGGGNIRILTHRQAGIGDCPHQGDDDGDDGGEDRPVNEEMR